jgi:excisionase family DNA binding protein
MNLHQDTPSAPSTRNGKLAYTISEFCAAAGLGKTSVYELIKDGQLQSVKAAGRRLILSSDAEAFLQRCRDAATSP